MLAKVLAGGVTGLDAHVVTVEVDQRLGQLAHVDVVGLPEAAVKEAKVRVRAALRNCGYELPPTQIAINLAPANLRKSGAAYDLPIAVGIIASTAQIQDEALSGTLILGELSLDGRVEPVPGVLPIALAAREHGIGSLIVPAANVAEAAAVHGLTVHGARGLGEVLDHLRGSALLDRAAGSACTEVRASDAPDLAEVAGQLHARRALEVAAAGQHALLMVGSPGAGKTMLARRLPGILPEMTPDEQLETSKIYSVAGLLRRGGGLLTVRPFRAPHSTCSHAALVGGGSPPRPGEASLAHNGVLFLDEILEFQSHTLETLRQPLEDGYVVIARARHSITYPCRLMLVASCNPCPCGHARSHVVECRCSDELVRRYRARLSGPLMDRIDMHVDLPPVGYEQLRRPTRGESSAVVRERVRVAWERQLRRSEGRGVPNSRLDGDALRRACHMHHDSESLLQNAVDRQGMSARGLTRVLRVARTIADLDGHDVIQPLHVCEALAFRLGEPSADGAGAGGARVPLRVVVGGA